VRAPVGKTGLGAAETRENQRKVNALRPSSHAANSLQRLFRGSKSSANHSLVESIARPITHSNAKTSWHEIGARSSLLSIPNGHIRLSVVETY
jgi:hypothetical protein